MEFGLVFLVLMAILLGVLEVSRLFFINTEIENGAREGAQYASLHPGVSAATLNTAVNSRLALADPAMVTITGPIYAPVPGQRCTFCRVSVVVSYQWQSLVPLVNIGPLTLVYTSTKLIENAGN